MKRWLITPVAALILMTSAVPAQGQPAANVSTLVKDNNAFAFDLYAKLRKREGNLFLSPYSISNAMAMTYPGARGPTANEIKTAMHFGLGQKGLPPAFRALIKRLHGEKRKYKLQVANRLWGQRNYGFRPEFLKLTREYYGAGLEEVDYASDFKGARKIINVWVEKRTNNKIKELLKPGILNSLTRLVLTNAIYFKAAWQRPFNPKQTRPGDFHVTAKQKIKIPMMRYVRMRTRYHDAGTLHVLELPYQKRELSMIVMAPKNVDGLANLEKTLTPATVMGWLSRLSTHLVDVTLPKFKVTSEFMLNDALEDLGIKLAFDRNRADFSGMATQEQLFIRAVVHKAFVDVNEKGTEAAASTAVVINARSRPPRATFTADRPFVYLIRDNRTGSILFMGRLTNPGN